MLWILFKTFFKIGLFTFGGGYGMIALVKDVCINQNHWIEDKEFVDIVAIAECTPGPIAVNMATYIGYKKAKLPGAICATIGVVLPSLIIIYLIAMYFERFFSIKIVSNALFGIRVAASIIIIKTAYDLIKSELKHSVHKKLTFALFIIYTLVLLYVNIMNINISSVTFIIFAFILGIVFMITGIGKPNDIS